jgi:hypothetical protein
MPSSSAVPGSLGFYKARFEIENSLTRSVLKTIPPDKLAHLGPMLGLVKKVIPCDAEHIF